MSDEQIDGMEQVIKLKRKLNDAVQQNKESHILKILSRLGHTSMTLDILQTTHIGKEVNGLRKMKGNIGEKAKSLVKNWKKLVPQVTPQSESQSNYLNSSSVGTSHATHQPLHHHTSAEKEDDFAQALQSTPPMIATRHQLNRDHRNNHHREDDRSSSRHRGDERSSSHHHGDERSSSHHHGDERSNSHHRGNERSRHKKKERAQKQDPPFNGTDCGLPSSSTLDQLNITSVSDSFREISPSSSHDLQPNSSSEETSSTTSQSSIQRKRKATFETSLDSVSLSKRSRTQIYSGKKRSITGPQVVPSLQDLVTEFLIHNIDALYEVGGVPFHVLEKVLQKCNPSQLMRLEEYNPHFLEDTDGLWEKHTQKHFKGVSPTEDQTWRELYMERLAAQEEKLKNLAASIKEKEKARKEPVRTAKQVIPTRVPRRRHGGGTRAVPPTFVPGGRRSFEKPAVHASPLMKQTLKMAQRRNHMMTFKPGKR